MSTERAVPDPADSAVLNREDLLATVLDSLTEGVVACDARGELTFFNRATSEFHGLGVEPIPSGAWAEHYSLYRADGTLMTAEEVPLTRALKGEVLHDAVMVIAPHEGDARTVLCSGGPIHRDGRLLGAVVVMRDISSQIAAERHKADAARERELNRAKDEFLATLAHELRTPLTSILGWTQMLRLRDEEATRALAAIEESTRMQAQLIEDLTDISRITSGKLLLNVERLRLTDVLQSAAIAVRPSAEQKNVSMMMGVVNDALLVDGDPLRLQQVFWNLLVNAIKFTPPGGHISIRTRTDSDSVHVDVQDSGIGFTRDFAERIFDRYSQEPGRFGAGNRGLGLGLSIARSIVELHDGSISAYSEGADLGATFSVTLPLAR